MASSSFTISARKATKEEAEKPMRSESDAALPSKAATTGKKQLIPHQLDTGGRKSTNQLDTMTDHDSGVDDNNGEGTSPPIEISSVGRNDKSVHVNHHIKSNQSTTNSRSRNRVPTTTGQRHRQQMPRSKSVPKPLASWSTPTATSETVKKVSMNKIKVGLTHSPNLKQVKSKIGSLKNASHKPGGGDVKIEHRKLDWKKEGRTDAINDSYKPGGGDVKVENRKLEWNTSSKIGSLENAKHKAGGGQVKIVDEKKVFVGQSKVGSLQNIKHKAGGGDKKVFNDVEYLRVASTNNHSPNPTSTTGSRRESDTQSLDPSPAAT